MKRHTFMSDGYYAISGEENFDDQNENYCGAAIDKLAEYENLEEQGRLVILPCKVVCGMDIWWADSSIHTEPVKCEVCSFGIYSGNDGKLQPWLNCYIYGESGENRSFRVSSIGKTIFLTRKEAEEALND